MQLTPLVFTLLSLSACAADSVRTPSATAGAALHGGKLITWGEQLIAWDLPSLHPKLLVQQRLARSEGGCVFENGFVLQEGLPLGRLVLRRPPDYAPELLDTGVQMHDCAAATLFGRPGIIVVHRFAQVRFYQRPERSGERWPYRELYSIYTPSRQGGLLVEDIDGDGRPDIVCGNYWMQSPAEFDLPWREFAINTWSETPESATLRFARLGSDLIVAQAHRLDAHLARFSRSSAVTQLWNERRLAEGIRLRRPHAIAVVDGLLVAGENDGPGSRLFLFRDPDRPEQIGVTNGVHSAFSIGGRLLTVGARAITWWTIQPRR